MKRYAFLCRIALSSVLVLQFLLSGCGGPDGTAGGPRPGVKSLDAEGCMQISDGDRCPVCAMRVSTHAKFASAIQLENGSTYYFCGTGCMLKSWLHPEVFLGVDGNACALPVVKDYFNGKDIDARTATWVAGSDVVGPMGPALVPLGSPADAETFKKRHGGKHTFSMKELTDERWHEIMGRKVVPDA